jgi:hypothetical protein
MRRRTLEDQVGLSEADQIHHNFNQQDTKKGPPSRSKKLPYPCFPNAEGLSVPGQESLPPGRISQSKEEFSQQAASLNYDREDNRSERQEDYRSA